MDSMGVNIIGFFTSQFGVAELARRLAEMMRLAKIPHVCNDIPRSFAKYNGDIPNLSNICPYHINIVCAQWYDITDIMHVFGPDIFTDRYNIGIWSWETDVFPIADAGRYIYLYDEIWTTSIYTKKSIVSSIDRPVEVIHFPISHPILGRYPLPDRFVVLFIFSYLSEDDRKNPTMVVEAFTRAFGHDNDVLLVLKSNGSERVPDKTAKLTNAISGYDNILHIRDNLTNSEKWNLLNTCDVYLSLHMSEGLGFTCLEAMSIGKPVIATGYTGNMEYMNNDNSIPIPYTIVDIETGIPPYGGYGRWALPSIDTAIEQLRRLRQDKELRLDIGNKARQYIDTNWSLAVCTDLMKKVLFDSLIRLVNKPRREFRALYGIQGKYMDVSHHISHMITNHGISIPAFNHNSIFGDPLPSIAKHLRVEHILLKEPLILEENSGIEYKWT